MSNLIQLRRNSTSGVVPATLQPGELAANLADNRVFLGNGISVIDITAAANIHTDTNHQFVTQAEKDSWNTAFTLPVATATVLGAVKIGSNIQVEADGTIHLDLATSETTGLLTATDWSTFNGKQNALGYVPVDKAGDTMTGNLTIPAGTAAGHAVNKGQLDSALGGYLALSGGTMTGSLVLAADAAAAYEAVTFQQFQSGLSSISGKYAAPVQALTDLSAIVAIDREDKQMRLVEDTGAIFRFDVQSTDAADGTGIIMPDDNPASGRWVKVSAATQNHENLFGLQGGAAGDHQHLTSAEKSAINSHLTDTDVHLTSAQNAWLDGITATSTEVNYLVGVTSGIQSQLDGKQASLGYTPVNKAGDTMLGDLVLFADPTLAMHPVTKQYLEAYVVDGGAF